MNIPKLLFASNGASEALSTPSSAGHQCDEEQRSASTEKDRKPYAGTSRFRQDVGYRAASPEARGPVKLD